MNSSDNVDDNVDDMNNIDDICKEKSITSLRAH